MTPRLPTAGGSEAWQGGGLFLFSLLFRSIWLPTATRGSMPAGALVCATVLLLKLLHQRRVCVPASTMLRESGPGKNRLCPRCQAKPSRISGRSPLPPSPKKRTSFTTARLEQKEREGSFYLPSDLSSFKTKSFPACLRSSEHLRTCCFRDGRAVLSYFHLPVGAVAVSQAANVTKLIERPRTATPHQEPESAIGQREEGGRGEQRGD